MSRRSRGERGASPFLGGVRRGGGIIRNSEGLSVVAVIEPSSLIARERSRPAAAEDSDLVPTFVHGAVAIYSLGNRKRGAARTISGDQFGRRSRTETVGIRRILGG